MSGIMNLLLGAVPQVVPDPYFEYTTLLLPGNGTNGAQNNTFLDSSTNNFTITRNGNTTQGTFSPFSQTGWGNYFDGSSLLTFASSANYVPGSGEFCLECWFMPTATGAERWLIGNRNGNYVPFAILYTGSSAPTALLFYMSSNGSTWNVINGGYAYGVVANQWNHLALVRSGTSIIAYINGVGTTLATSSANFSTAQPFYVGGSPSAGDLEFVGYISNVRFVKGSTPYSGSTITVPTTPLTAITNTQLLTSQSNRFLDNSTNAVTPSITGSPSVQAFSPFNPTAAWSAATNGGSGYWDGAGDYLEPTANAAFAFGTGNFTLECWIYATGANDDGIYEGRSTGVVGDGFTLTAFSSSVIRMYTTSALITASGLNYLNQWTHVALVCNAGTTTLYINGVSKGSTTTVTNCTHNGPVIGIGRYSASSTPTAANSFNGYIADFRIVKGTAVYTTDFTPSTAPLTAITNTSLLLSTTNAGIYDATSKNDLETVGNAQISTTQSKFGGSSMYFDGTGDYLASASSPLLALGTGDLTVEFWFRASSVGSNQRIVQNTVGGFDSTSYILRINASSKLEVAFAYPDVSASSSISIANNTWYHVALVRFGTSVKVYLNGTQEISGTSSGNMSNQYVYVGGYYTVGNTEYFTGYVQDLRITKGIARYTSAFTPPTAAFPLL